MNVLSRFMAISFTVRNFSCKALKEFQKSYFSINYECLVLIQKNKGNFFIVEFFCGCPARSSIASYFGWKEIFEIFDPQRSVRKSTSNEYFPVRPSLSVKYYIVFKILFFSEALRVSLECKWKKNIGTMLRKKGRKKKKESWAKGKGIHIHNDEKKCRYTVKTGT